jgi:hypothetical protein
MDVAVAMPCADLAVGTSDSFGQLILHNPKVSMRDVSEMAVRWRMNDDYMMFTYRLPMTSLKGAIFRYILSLIPSTFSKIYPPYRPLE